MNGIKTSAAPGQQQIDENLNPVMPEGIKFSSIRGNRNNNRFSTSSATLDQQILANNDLKPVEDLQLQEDIGTQFSVGPTTLQDLEDVLYNESSALGNVAKASANLIGKTAIQVGGGLGGAVYGLGAWAASGDFSSFYDNSFTDLMDEGEKALKSKFRIYSDKQSKDMFILNKMVQRPTLFIDEYADAIAFTLGAILTQNVLGGISKIGKLAQLSKTLRPAMVNNFKKGLDVVRKGSDGKNLVMATNAVTQAGKLGQMTQQTLLTGAAWESIIETKHAMKELRTKLENNGFSEDEINKRIDSAEKGVFGTNMAILSVSNMIQFPKIFGTPEFLKFGKRWAQKAGSLKSPLKLHSLSKDGTAQMAGKWRKGLIKAGYLVKNPLTEGNEEFMQGVISKGMINSYGKGYEGEEVSWNKIMNSIGDAAVKGLTTTEGLNEIMMGALIGGMGSPSIRNKAVKMDDNTMKSKLSVGFEGGLWGAHKEFNAKYNAHKEAVDAHNEAVESGDINKMAKSVIGHIVASDHASNLKLKAMTEDKVFDAASAHQDEIYHNFAPYLENGFKDLAMARLDIMNQMSNEEFMSTVMDQDSIDMLDKDEISRLRKSFDSIMRDNLSAMQKNHNIIERSHLTNPITKKLAKYYLYKSETAKTDSKRADERIKELLSKSTVAQDLYALYESKADLSQFDKQSAEAGVQDIKTALGINEDTRAEYKSVINDINEAFNSDSKDKAAALKEPFSKLISMVGPEVARSTMEGLLDKSKTDEEKADHIANIKKLYDDLLTSEEANIVNAVEGTIEERKELGDLIKSKRNMALMQYRATDLFNQNFANEKSLKAERDKNSYADLMKSINDPETLNNVNDQKDLDEYNDQLDEYSKELSGYSEFNKDDEFSKARKEFNDKAKEQIKLVNERKLALSDNKEFNDNESAASKGSENFVKSHYNDVHQIVEELSEQQENDLSIAVMNNVDEFKSLIKDLNDRGIDLNNANTRVMFDVTLSGEGESIESRPALSYAEIKDLKLKDLDSQRYNIRATIEVDLNGEIKTYSTFINKAGGFKDAGAIRELMDAILVSKSGRVEYQDIVTVEQFIKRGIPIKYESSNRKSNNKALINEINKRRKEELNSNRNIRISKTKYIGDFEGDKIITIISRMADGSVIVEMGDENGDIVNKKRVTNNEKIANLKGLLGLVGHVSVDGGEYKLVEGTILSKEELPLPRSKAKDKINAKYDAEIEALNNDNNISDSVNQSTIEDANFNNAFKLESGEDLSSDTQEVTDMIDYIFNELMLVSNSEGKYKSVLEKDNITHADLGAAKVGSKIFIKGNGLLNNTQGNKSKTYKVNQRRFTDPEMEGYSELIGNTIMAIMTNNRDGDVESALHDKYTELTGHVLPNFNGAFSILNALVYNGTSKDKTTDADHGLFLMHKNNAIIIKGIKYMMDHERGEIYHEDNDGRIVNDGKLDSDTFTRLFNDGEFRVTIDLNMMRNEDGAQKGTYRRLVFDKYLTVDSSDIEMQLTKESKEGEQDSYSIDFSKSNMLQYKTYVGERKIIRDKNAKLDNEVIASSGQNASDILSELDNSDTVSRISKSLGVTNKDSLESLFKTNAFGNISFSKQTPTILEVNYNDGGGLRFKLDFNENIRISNMYIDEDGNYILDAYPYKMNSSKEEQLEYLSKFGITKIGGKISLKASELQSVGSFIIKNGDKKYDVFGAEKEKVVLDNVNKTKSIMSERWKASSENNSKFRIVGKNSAKTADGTVHLVNKDKMVSFKDFFTEDIDPGVLALMENFADKMIENSFNEDNGRRYPMNVIRKTFESMGLKPKYTEDVLALRDDDGKVVMKKGKDGKMHKQFIVSPTKNFTTKFDQERLVTLIIENVILPAQNDPKFKDVLKSGEKDLAKAAHYMAAVMHDMISGYERYVSLPGMYVKGKDQYYKSLNMKDGKDRDDVIFFSQYNLSRVIKRKGQNSRSFTDAEALLDASIEKFGNKLNGKITETKGVPVSKASDSNSSENGTVISGGVLDILSGTTDTKPDAEVISESGIPGINEIDLNEVDSKDLMKDIDAIANEQKEISKDAPIKESNSDVKKDVIYNTLSDAITLKDSKAMVTLIDNLTKMDSKIDFIDKKRSISFSIGNNEYSVFKNIDGIDEIEQALDNNKVCKK